MRHIFGTIVILIIIILGVFSVKFLIYGFPSAIENSRFVPIISQNNDTSYSDCKEKILAFDIRQSGNILISSNFKFNFVIPNGWVVEEVIDPDDTSVDFYNESISIRAGLIPARMKQSCYAELKEEILSYNSDEFAIGFIKALRPKTLISILGTSKFKLISRRNFVRDNDLYFEYSISTSSEKDRDLVLYESFVMILRPNSHIYMFPFAAANIPISQDTIDKIVSSITFN